MVKKVIKCIIIIKTIQNSKQFNLLHFKPYSLKKKKLILDTLLMHRLYFQL